MMKGQKAMMNGRKLVFLIKTEAIFHTISFYHVLFSLYHANLRSRFYECMFGLSNQKSFKMELHIQNLTKVYPNGVKALNNISITIANGMFGLLGPNGAGKSTLMRTIATLQNPDSGSISFNDTNILEDQMGLRKVLGYLPQEFGVYPRLSAEKLLDYLAQLKGVSNSAERKALIGKCLEITNLENVRKKHVSGYSGGMKQRFGIAQLLLNNPSLIIVDEPTAGLDPAERQRFLNILREIGKENIVIFSTHIVEDIKDLCTDMAILNQGEVLMHTKPSQAIENIESHIFKKEIQEHELPQYESEHQILSSNHNSSGGITIRIFSESGDQEGFVKTGATLEDVYFNALYQEPVLEN